MKIFYGWRMVGAACGIQFLLAAFLTQALGLYIAVLSDEMGWSKTTLSGAAALQSVESAIIGPVLGWIMDKVGPQAMIRLGMVLFSAGLLLLSQVNAVATFYTSAILMAIGASLSGYFPLSVALVQWFEKFRARALSTMSLGLAMGGLAVPLMAWSIQHWGWRYTAGGTGLVVLLFGLPLAGMILRRPEDHGQHIDGIDPALKAAEQGDSPADVQVEFTAKEAVQTRAFWMLAVGHGLALLIVSAVNVHAITHMKEGLGYSVANASWVILFMTFAQLGGVLMGATLGDMFEKRKVAALCMLAHALGMLLPHLCQRHGHARCVWCFSWCCLGLARPLHASHSRRLFWPQRHWPHHGIVCRHHFIGSNHRAHVGWRAGRSDWRLPIGLQPACFAISLGLAVLHVGDEAIKANGKPISSDKASSVKPGTMSITNRPLAVQASVAKSV